jgi:hypothetical protein
MWTLANSQPHLLQRIDSAIEIPFWIPAIALAALISLTIWHLGSRAMRPPEREDLD